MLTLQPAPKAEASEERELIEEDVSDEHVQAVWVLRCALCFKSGVSHFSAQHLVVDMPAIVPLKDLDSRHLH